MLNKKIFGKGTIPAAFTIYGHFSNRGYSDQFFCNIIFLRVGLGVKHPFYTILKTDLILFLLMLQSSSKLQESEGLNLRRRGLHHDFDCLKYCL